MALFTLLALILILLALLKAKGIKLIYFHIPLVSVFWGCVLFVLLGVPIDYFFYGARFSHNYWVVYTYTSIFILGLIFGLLMSWRLASASDYQFRIIKKGRTDHRIFWLLYVFGILLIILLYVRMPEIPLFSDDVHEARIRSLTGLGYNYKVGLFCFYLGLFGLVLHYLDKNKKAVSLILACVAFMAILPTANRIDSLFILFLFGMAVLYIRLWQEKNYAPLLYFKCLILGLFVFILSAILQYVRHFGIAGFIEADFGDILSFSKAGVYHRFWVQLENISYLIDRNVNTPPFLTFVNDIMMVIPGSGVHQTSGVLLKEAADLEFRGGGITPTFIGEGIVQFGYFGGAVYCFVFSFIVSLSSSFAVRLLRRRYLFFPYLFVGSFFLHGVSTSTIFSVLTHSIAPVVLIFLISIFMIKFLKSFHNKKHVLRKEFKRVDFGGGA